MSSNKNGPHSHTHRYIIHNDDYRLFRKYIKRIKELDSLLESTKSSNSELNDVKYQLYESNQRIASQSREIDTLKKDLENTVSYYKSEVSKVSQYRVDRIVPCYNDMISKLFYSIFDSDDIEDVRAIATSVIKSGTKKLESFGIQTQVYVPGSTWNDSDYSEEPTFIETDNPDLFDTICNCSLFGLSFKDDSFPSILANIEVFCDNSNGTGSNSHKESGNED